jgi:phosphoribosylformylglycinamidine synthase
MDSADPLTAGAPVARVVVDVMLKPEILDPQGKAIAGALPRLGFAGVTSVRQGKRFELEIDGEVTEQQLAEVEEIARTLLSNPVIEDYAVTVPSSALAAGEEELA